MIHVTVWNEYIHEPKEEAVRQLYPGGIHSFIASFLKSDDIEVRTATLNEPEHGLTDEVLAWTDVLVWWGHLAHEQVEDQIVKKVADRVLCGMGLVVLHSGHLSKIFRRLMGTSCTLRWRDGDHERLWCVDPAHPIAEGLPEYFELQVEEMYGEFFDIPKPDELIFLGWFKGGELFRSGCLWNRGYGKVFYFQPGHEENPTFHNQNIQKVIRNAVKYVSPRLHRTTLNCPHVPPAEDTNCQI